MVVVLKHTFDDAMQHNDAMHKDESDEKRVGEEVFEEQIDGPGGVDVNNPMLMQSF